jgi:spore coat protein U domain-containing protein, fimbrial subunit CupE1/2/3/6
MKLLSDKNIILVALAACVFAGAAEAALTCTASATGVAFGVYNQFAASPLDSTGTVSFSCSLTFPSSASNVKYTIGLSSGGSGSMLARQMTSVPNQLAYNLYTSSAYAQIWGDGTSGTGVVSNTMKLGSPGFGWDQTDTYTIFGRILAGQNALPGTYSDTIIVTVTF